MLNWLWEFFVDTMIILFMPAVCSYYVICGDLFLNVSANNATGLEKAGNTLLVPVQYLLAGRIAIPKEHGDWEFQQRFEYQSAFWMKTTACVIALPASLVMGSIVKAFGLLASDARMRYASLAAAQNCTECKENTALYKALGIEIREIADAERFFSQGYKRRPGDERHLHSAKIALGDIAKVFDDANIPWWVDCGTCLGAYRYGGVIPWDGDIDLGILWPDFENARRALNRLDPKKYQIQNWSGRSIPNTFFKIYIKESASMVDIDCFAIEPENQQIHCIFSLEESIFFPEWLKIRERRYCVPAPFSMVFPLKRAMFDGIEVSIPNQTKEYLQRCYGENLDPAKIYDPQTGRFEKDLSHPYWQREYVH